MGLSSCSNGQVGVGGGKFVSRQWEPDKVKAVHVESDREGGGGGRGEIRNKITFFSKIRSPKLN